MIEGFAYLLVILLVILAGVMFFFAIASFDGGEILLFLISLCLLCIFLFRWYKPLSKTWPPKRNRATKIMLGLLPAVFLIIIFITLKFFASFDVVDSVFYIIFYIVLGYAWMYGGLLLMSICFDLHWLDDVVYLNNKAALAAVAGEFLALALIYAGANVGDGPGWWCVLFAATLGIAAWLATGFVVHYCTGIFERITVDRDLGCGIRFFLYLLCSGAILGYACSGDWTSFSMTIEEFGAAWPILPLTAVFIIIERACKHRAQREVAP